VLKQFQQFYNRWDMATCFFVFELQFEALLQCACAQAVPAALQKVIIIVLCLYNT
jgi:hypothetical protein